MIMNTTGKSKELAKEIAALELDLKRKQAKLTLLRKKLPSVESNDYIFHDIDANEVRLSELFGESNELIVVHNMGKSCTNCTLWADEYNGVISHIESRAPFIVVSPDEPPLMKEFANSRNWKFRIFSSKLNSFKRDMGFENAKGIPVPGVSVFTKDKKGKIFHYSKTMFGPGDNFCSVWHYFDLLPGGIKKWSPKLKY